MKNVDVLCIPADGNAKWTKVVVPLVKAAEMEHGDQSFMHENWLVQVPNIFDDEGWKVHGRNHRCLVQLGELHPDQFPPQLSDRRGPYFMYTCIKEGKGCPPNEHFQKAMRAQDSKTGIYGSAFIFKIKEPAFDTKGIVRYGDLDTEKMWLAFEKREIAFEKILVWLETGCIPGATIPLWACPNDD